MLSVIQSGLYAGSLGFWKPNNNTNHNPQMILTNNNMEIRGKITIKDGSEGTGKVQISDANGNGI